jgi:hypothetical protein
VTLLFLLPMHCLWMHITLDMANEKAIHSRFAADSMPVGQLLPTLAFAGVMPVLASSSTILL